ncbi:MAG: sugar transferase [Enterovibrio sp.]
MQALLNLVKKFIFQWQKANEPIVYVYCPVEYKNKIEQISKAYPFTLVVNDYSLTQLKGKVICHHESAKLSTQAKEFLISATKLGAWVEPLVNYLDRRLGYTEVELLYGSYFLHQKAFSIASRHSFKFLAYCLELIFCLLLGLMALPVGLITAAAIKLESPGPIFYRQKRVGQYEQEFEMIKFRSMCVDAEKNGAQWASQNDTRITKVGAFIRKTHIDELPQIINVLQGKMSIIGPRPEREAFIKKLEAKIPYYRFRHAVKPGITGLAQVSYPYGASIEDAVWKHKYDIYYIKHHTIWLDIKILLNTVKVVIFRMGR